MNSLGQQNILDLNPSYYTKDSSVFVLILHIFVQIHSKWDNIIKHWKPCAFTQKYN